MENPDLTQLRGHVVDRRWNPVPPLDHTKAELRKIGPIAGDYFAEQFDAMAPDDRSLLYYEAGSFGSERLHQSMIRHLKNEQEA